MFWRMPCPILTTSQLGHRICQRSPDPYRSYPVQWAKAQANLGGSLAERGNVGSGSQSVRDLMDALVAYHEAMTVRTETDMPKEWADDQTNIGTVLGWLGEREQGAEQQARFAKSIEAYSAALRHFTKAKLPEDWAHTQTNLANAYWRQSFATNQLEEGTVALEKALESHHAALEVYTRETFPQDWALTQRNMGAVLAGLSQMSERTDSLERRHALSSLAYQRRFLLTFFPSSSWLSETGLGRFVFLLSSNALPVQPWILM